MRVGVLALQGNFAAHAKALQELGIESCEVREAKDLKNLDGLILPGGESSTHLKLIERYNLKPALQEFAQSNKPILATCAGLILAAEHVSQPEQKSLGWLKVSVARNAFGRQIHSFTALADNSDLPLMFIRAPRFIEIAPEVEILARYQGEPVLVKQGNIVGATFHPEMTQDRRVQAFTFGLRQTL